MANSQKENMFNRKSHIHPISEILISTLGYELYARIYRIFKEICLDEEYYYKVFMARKCYALYKAFEPVLRVNHVKTKGIITNDKMFVSSLKYEKHKSQLSTNLKILVIDDTILFGRTFRNFLNRLGSPSFNIKPENIAIYALFISNDRKESDKDLKVYPYVECDKNNKPTVFVCGDNRYRFNSYHNSYIAFLNTEKVRGYSLRLIEAIHAVSAPYVACIPAFRVKNSSMRKLIEKKDSKWKNLNSRLKELDCYENSFDEKDDDLHAYYLMYKSNDIDDNIRISTYSCIRIYVNMKLDLLTVIPYIIFPAIERTKSDKVDELMTRHEWFSECDFDEDFQTEVNYVRFVASYLLGMDFFAKYGVKQKDIELVTTEGFGRNQIIKSISKSNLSSINELFKNNCYRFLTDNDELPNDQDQKDEKKELDSVIKEPPFSSDKFNRQTNKQTKTFFLYNLLSHFNLYALIRDCNNQRSCELDLKHIIDKLNKEFQAGYNSILAALIQSEDNGHSALYTNTIEKDGRKIAYCASQNGEQAAQIIGRVCDGFTYAIYVLFLELSEQGKWDEYKNDIKSQLFTFVNQWQKDKIKESLSEDKNEDPISEAFMERIIFNNPAQWHMDSVKYIIPNGSKEAEYMRDFPNAFLTCIEETGENKKKPLKDVNKEINEHICEFSNIWTCLRSKSN
jgi:hypothetical protein